MLLLTTPERENNNAVGYIIASPLGQLPLNYTNVHLTLNPPLLRPFRAAFRQAFWSAEHASENWNAAVFNIQVEKRFESKLLEQGNRIGWC